MNIKPLLININLHRIQLINNLTELGWAKNFPFLCCKNFDFFWKILLCQWVNFVCLKFMQPNL